jgi:hypothetical protein
MNKPPGHDEERLELPDAVQNVLEEARMVLPGLQALFGFQLIAVFNDRFDLALDHAHQVEHLVSLLCVAAAVALLMTPAACHRQWDPMRVSVRFLGLTSHLIRLGMLVFAVGLSLDIHLVAFLVTDSDAVSIALGVFVLAALLALWVLYPHLARRRQS